MQGTIIRWDDERGFGFVKEEITKTEIFVHISAFNFTNPRPEIGDQIEFETFFNEKKEKTEIIKAVHLNKKPALTLEKNKRPYTKKRSKYQSSNRRQHKNNSYLTWWQIVVLIIVLVWIVFSLLSKYS